MRYCLICFFVVWGTVLYAQEEPLRKVESLMAKNRYYEALKCVDSLNNAGVKISDLLFYAGKASEGVLRYKDAYRYYKQWLLADTTNREARIAIARVLALAGKTVDAVGAYEKLAGEDSLDFAINYQLARLYQQTGKTLKAVPVYLRLAGADTTNATLLKRLGDCYVEIGLSTGAARSYCDAFWLDPADGGTAVKAINVMLANQNMFTDFVDYALDMVDTALVYSPHLNTVKQTRGVLEYVAKRFGKCEKTFDELIVGGDSVRFNYKYLGLARYQQKHFKEALLPLALADSLFRDKQGNRTDMEVAMRYGESLAKSGEPRKALQVFLEIEDQLQPDPQFLSQLAVMCGMACGYSMQQSGAVDYYWKAYKLDPKNKQAISNFVNWKYDVLVDKEKRSKASEKEIRVALFAQILFLQNVKDFAPARGNTMHSVSREILKQELDELFFSDDKHLTVMDPDGKTYVYSADDIRELINR